MPSRSMPSGGVALDDRRHPLRLQPGDEARGGDRVAADVEQPAAAPLGDVAHVGGVGQVVAEMALDRLQLADPAAPDQLARPQPLRVGADHERFLDSHAGAVAHRDQLRALGGVEPDRLLAQHVLAGLGGLDRPGHVQVVGQRIVDRVDLGVGQELLVAAVAARRCRAWPRPRAARAGSREASATTSQRSARISGGITFSRAILAAPRTPNRACASPDPSARPPALGSAAATLGHGVLDLHPPTCFRRSPAVRVGSDQANSSPTMPRRKVRTQTTKIAPCTTVTQAPSWAR